MRKFDFPNPRATIYSAGRASAIWVTELDFRLSPGITSAVQVQPRQNPVAKILEAKLPARSIKWSYRAGSVSIQSKAYGCANLRHAQISAQNEFQ
jgi:hypothetical protein